jgi:glycosidase
LAEIPDEELELLRNYGFNWLYLLGVWQTGETGRLVSRNNPAWRAGYAAALSDFHEEDVSGSPFAIAEYRVHSDFGGDRALQILRERLRRRDIRLMLDFVPNHTAIDHPWVEQHPNRYMAGDAAALMREPHNYVRAGRAILAHGRDPYFPGWVDTVQLDYSNPETSAAMMEELCGVAEQCDGLRCDMAMLLLPEIFERTWGKAMKAFWPAAIERVRQSHPEFVLLAEVYWGRERELQQQGFDYTYDKTLYDRIVEGSARGVRNHLSADNQYQRKMARFLENHDEQRIASLLPTPAVKAAALVAYGVPGLRFFHDGQLEGARRKPSIHLRRREREAVDGELKAFYEKLLSALDAGMAQGDWLFLELTRAWDTNWTAECFLCFAWIREGVLRDLFAVNFSDHQSQCFVRLPLGGIPGATIVFRDHLSSAVYERATAELAGQGLFLDLTAWGGHLFRVT